LRPKGRKGARRESERDEGREAEEGKFKVLSKTFNMGKSRPRDLARGRNQEREGRKVGRRGGGREGGVVEGGAEK
jgi:hypothetical protein